MNVINFVAVDVETATSNRSSICQLSLAFVADGQITEKKSWLIQPPENKYDAFNTYIHGIDAAATAEAPAFPDVWPEIKSLLDNRIVVAHNTAFDMYALHDALELYSLDYPTFDYYCTLRLSKELLHGIPNYTLPEVYLACTGEHLQNHHDATADALACAEIMCRLFKLADVDSFETLAERFRIRKGEFAPGMFVAQSKMRDYSNRVNALDRIQIPDESQFDPDNYFYGKAVCFTGTCSFGTRLELLQKIADVGGIPVNSVTKKTDVLVVGQQDYRVVGEDGMSNKQEKAMKLLQSGQPIEILSESDFLQLIN